MSLWMSYYGDANVNDVNSRLVDKYDAEWYLKCAPIMQCLSFTGIMLFFNCDRNLPFTKDFYSKVDQIRFIWRPKTCKHDAINIKKVLFERHVDMCLMSLESIIKQLLLSKKTNFYW